jgi:hypothetical protein
MGLGALMGDVNAAGCNRDTADLLVGGSQELSIKVKDPNFGNIDRKYVISVPKTYNPN